MCSSVSSHHCIFEYLYASIFVELVAESRYRMFLSS